MNWLVKDQRLSGLLPRRSRLTARLTLAVHPSNVRVPLAQIGMQRSVGHPHQPLLLLSSLLLRQSIRKAQHHPR